MAIKFKACSVDGCNGNAHWTANGARGWCTAHYQRWRAYGDPLKTAPKTTRIGAPERYLADKPCRHGHLSVRLVSTKACVECVKLRYAKWYSKNKDAKNAADRARTSNSGSCVTTAEKKADARARYRQWYSNSANRSKKALADSVHYRNYQAKKRNAEGSHNLEDIRHIRRMQNDKCGYCRQKLNDAGHVDHITAISKGGSNRRRNLQLLCVSCNTSKGARDPLVYARAIGKLL